MQNCPKCGSPGIYRSRTRSWWERLRKTLTGKYAYRCHSCGWRGFGEDTGPKFDPEHIEAANRAVIEDAEDDDDENP